MITLKRSDYERMLTHAQACQPLEACGLLAGTIDAEGNKTVERIYLLSNVDHSQAHFSIDPVEQFAAVREMRVNGLAPLGNWHSHPATPARPSAEDIRLAYDSKASYLILSLAEPETPVLRAFHIENGAATQEDLRII